VNNYYGGLNSLYQIGGPHSIQLALKLLRNGLFFHRGGFGALTKIGSLEFSSCAVANVEDFHALLFLDDAVDHAIDMRLVTVEQVS
jgi:hypothetical protein